MRQEQYEKLQQLIEDLTDAAILEADPTGWPGQGIEPKNMDQQTRGDRYWCKKNAAATLTLTMKCMSLVGVIQQRAGGLPPGEGDVPQEAVEGEDGMDADIKRYEKQASKLLNQVQKRVAARNG